MSNRASITPKRTLIKLFVRITSWLVALLLLLIAVTVVLHWAPDRPVWALQARWAAPPSVFIDVAGMQVHLRDEGPRVHPSPIVFYGDPARVTPELVDRYYELTLREGNRAALVQRFKQAPATEASAARIKALKLPTLILWGGRDRLIRPDNAARFRREIVGSDVVVFDDLGHVPHEEDAGRTVAAVMRLLAPH